MSLPSWRLGNPIGAFFAIVVLPLAFVALGIWQQQRATTEIAALDARSAEIAAQITAMQAARGRTGKVDPALAGARDALRGMMHKQEQAIWRRNLAWIAVISGATAVVLGPLLMAAAFALGQAGRRSQATLVSGYRQVRRKLPMLLILLLFAWPAGIAAIGYGEVFSGDPVRLWLSLAFLLLALPLPFFGVLLAVPWGWIAGLPPPGPILVPGRPVSGDEAPGLWRLATTLAGRLGVAPPDLILVGLTDDLSLVAGPVTPEGTDRRLPDNALHVPLPYLAFHGKDEVAALIGYELAHFAGQDNANGEAFGAIHADIDRTLDTHAYGDAQGNTTNLLVLPAMPVGLYVMDQFRQAVQSWHRHRVFAADAAAATLVCPAAVARALLRRNAIRQPIREVLELAWRDHQQARATDFIAFALAQASQRGLDDPLPPSSQGDPSIRERILALGQDLSDTMIAEATAPPGPEAAARLGIYLADPEATVRDATKRFVSRGAPWRPIERR